MPTKSSLKSIYILVVVGFMFGFLCMVVINFLNIRDENVHYHANFALYVNDEQEKFDSFTFYEEVQACSAEDSPKTRAHMHSNENSVVHVHEASVTWGHFFANLGYGLGNNFVKTDSGVYVDQTNGLELRFVLNGKEVTDVANKVIGDKDRLLIDYGNSGQSVLDGRYKSIPETAAEHNNTSDPSTCSGSKPLTFTEKLKMSFGF